ncbi:MAG: hypothetical protein FWH36_02835 [Lentimicrobiaceae bacterium]|nr:hypothetical protein [Lentimicrobiaceae bacterium]
MLQKESMGKYICTLIVAFCLNLGQVSAHILFCSVRNYGNVTVISTSSEDNEEYNKAEILGKLAELLSIHLKYTEPIVINIETHQYADNCFPDFLISYGKSVSKYQKKSKNSCTTANVQYIRGMSKYRKKSKNNAIVIRHTSGQLQILSALKLVEYAILNRKNIKSTQKYIRYEKKYCFENKVKSINPLAIEEILNTPNSDLLNFILKAKIDMPEQQGISYYWKNNRYYVLWKSDTVLFNVENIYDIRRFEDSSAVIFDSDSSFYYVDYPKISKRQVVENPFGYSWFGVSKTDDEKLMFYLWHYRYFETIGGKGTKLTARIWTYLKEKDELILPWEEKDAYELYGKKRSNSRFLKIKRLR